MKNSRKMKASFAAAVCLLLPLAASAADVTASGGWNRTVDSSDLASGPGSDLNPTYESAANATSIDLLAVGNYRIDVRRSIGSWSGDLTLYVKRTSNGTGSGSISGGGTYQAVSTTNTEFFTGNSNRNGVEVQYQTTGMSVDVSPSNYTTNVIYTITDL